MVKIEWGHQIIFTLCPLVQKFEWGHKATVPLKILDLSGGTCPHGPHYNYLTGTKASMALFPTYFFLKM